MVWGVNDLGGSATTKSGSKKSTPTLTGFRTLTPKSPVAKLNTKYTGTYVPALKRANAYTPALAYQMYKFDLGRVNSGKQPLSSTEWTNAYHSLRHAHTGGIVKPKPDSGGFFSNAVNDLGNLASGLEPWRLYPAIVNEGQNILNLPQDIQKGKYKVQSLEDVLGLPGVRDIPGSYTLRNLAAGDFHTILAHPFSTAVDVIPYTSSITRLAALAKIDDIARVSGEFDNISEEATRLHAASDNLDRIHSEIEQIVKDRPNADISKANFTRTKLANAEADYTAAQQAFDDASKGIRPNEQVLPGSPLEAALEGKPIKALSRAVGLSDKVFGPSAEWLGIDKATAEITRFNALKMRGDAIRLPDTQAAWDRMAAAEGKLNDIVTHVQNEVKDLANAPFAKKSLVLAQAEYKAARTDFLFELKKEMIQQIGVIHGTAAAESLRADRFSLNADGELVDAAGKTPTYRDLITHNNKLGNITLRDLAHTFGLDELDIHRMEAQTGVPFDHISIPKYLQRSLRFLYRGEEGANPLAETINKSVDVFRYSLVTRPQHFLHIIATNMMSTLLQGGLSTFRFAGDAINMWRTGEWPEGMNKLSEFDTPMSKADTLMAVGQGKTFFRILKGVTRNFRATEEAINNIFRAMNYLQGEAKGLTDAELARISPVYERWGVDLSPEHVAGLEAVRKTALDMDSMTPIERSVIRQVIPFYAYTKYLMQFLFRFPFDHPFKAAMLASMGRREMEDFGTGLPQKFMDLFPVGSMDSSGNQLMIDTKSSNPFRSLNGFNPFTLAGFISELNPALQAPLTLSGVNVLTATPELYPTLKVDPKTGAFVQVHSGMLPTLIETFLPPTQSIDALFQLSDHYKSLKKNGGTQAQIKALFSAMGVSFLPQNINLSQERIKFANKNFSVGQAEAKSALQSGNAPTDQSSYPVRGEFLTSDELRKLLDQAKKVRASQGTNAPLTQYIGQGQ